jgi:hypothetical protein
VISPQRNPSADAALEPEPIGRLMARLLNGCGANSWRGYQHAHSHGRHERAELLERRARRYEELAEACHASMWQPKVRARRLSADERAELARVFDSQQRPEKRRSFSLVTGDEPLACTRSGVSEPRSYALAALRGEAEEVAAAPVGLRNETLNRAAWKLARLDALDHHEIEDVLVAAAHDCGLGALEARATIRGALRRRTP